MEEDGEGSSEFDANTSNYGDDSDSEMPDSDADNDIASEDPEYECLVEKALMESTVKHVKTLPLDEPIYPNMVRFVCVSDTHEQMGVLLSRIPRGDVFIHAGDFTDVGDKASICKFNDQLNSLPHRYKIVIAGNHEIGFEDGQDEANLLSYFRREGYNGTPEGYKLLTNCTYLMNSSVEVYGLKIYGAPWQTLWGWAFYRKRGHEIAKEWEKIPTATKSADGNEWLPGVDVLVTHGPPLGCKDLDVRDRKTRFGDLELLKCVKERVRPRFHVFGHIHEQNGAVTDGQTTFINASICANNLDVENPPVIFDIPLPKGKVKGFCL